MIAPTQKIARYELVREIGRGESGTVYEARDGVDGRTVALKVFRRDPATAEDAAAMAEFLRLAHHLMTLSHPNIVPILNCGCEAGLNYVVMELVPARSLRRWLDVVPRMSFEWVLSITLQVADALTRAHNAGICHHALKPANILLDEDGRVSVTDFAIPLLLAHSGNSTGVPSVPQYLAPEQVRAEVVDARADVFALGVIMYELLTGRAPFGTCADMSVIRVLENIVQQIPQPASAYDPDVPPALDRVVLKALSKSVVQRYGSAAEMARDLRMVERMLRGASAEQVLAVPPAQPVAVPPVVPAPPQPAIPPSPATVANSVPEPPEFERTVVKAPAPPSSHADRAAPPPPPIAAPPRAPAHHAPADKGARAETVRAKQVPARPPAAPGIRGADTTGKELERTETGALPQYDFLDDGPPAQTPARPLPPAASPAPISEPSLAAAIDDDFADLAADLDAFSKQSEEQLLSSQGYDVSKRKPMPDGNKNAEFPSLHATQPPAGRPPAGGQGRREAGSVPQQAAPAKPAKPAEPGNSGLLAQLSAAAERIQQREDLVTRSKREMRQRAESALPPTMRAAFQYFLRLCGHLDVVRPAIAREYPLLGAGAIRGLSWVSGHVDFRTRGVDGPEHINQILISYTLAGAESIRAERDGPSVQSLRRALEENGLHFEEDFAASARNRGESTVFTIFSEVKARILIRASYDDMRLRAILRNVERFATIEYEIDGARFDHAAWDEIGKLMLGQTSRFLTFAEPMINRMR